MLSKRPILLSDLISTVAPMTIISHQSRILISCVAVASLRVVQVTHGFLNLNPSVISFPKFHCYSPTSCRFIKATTYAFDRTTKYLPLFVTSLEEQEQEQEKKDQNTVTTSFSTETTKDTPRRIIAAPPASRDSILNLDEKSKQHQRQQQDTTSKAATNTVNARLMEELNNSISSTANPATKNKTLRNIAGMFASSLTEEERQRALEEARDLNGVNPFACLIASVVCFAFSVGLWVATNFLTEVFVLHPIQTDVYAAQRLASVFRNVVVGMTSLGAGFSGVTGLGLALLGFRVAYGVYVTGELDPTPILKSSAIGDRGNDFKGVKEFDVRDAFDLMMGNNKKGRNRKR